MTAQANAASDPGALRKAFVFAGWGLVVASIYDAIMFGWSWSAFHYFSKDDFSPPLPVAIVVIPVVFSILASVWFGLWDTARGKLSRIVAGMSCIAIPAGGAVGGFLLFGAATNIEALL